MPAGARISIPISVGELVDKITILRLKQRRFTDPSKVAHVAKELELLEAVYQDQVQPSPSLAEFTRQLAMVNEKLWAAEDAVRVWEQSGDLGDAFVAAAQSIIRLNDRRFELKCQINDLTGSRLVEEKSYVHPVDVP